MNMHPARKLVLACLLALGSALGASGPAAAQDKTPQYRIGPGDTLRFNFTVAPETGRATTVDLNGNVYVPPVGAIEVAGQTLSEVRENVPGLFAGTVLSERIGVENLLVSLSPNDVLIDVESYRPVYVTGEVELPGPVAFRIGMTIRQAIAEAQGVSDAVPIGTVSRISLREQPAVLAAELRNDLIEIAFRQAELTGKDEVDPAALIEQGASEAEAQEIAQAASDRLKTANASFDKRQSYLEQGAELARDRVVALFRQEEVMAEIVVEEEREVARVQSLVNRRVAPTDQLAAVKRLYLQAVEKLRDIRSEKLSFDAERRAIELERDQAPLTRRSDAQIALHAAQSDAALLRAQLTALGDAVGGGEFDAPAAANGQLRYTIHRMNGSGPSEIDSQPDDYLLPGDVVTVSRS